VKEQARKEAIDAGFCAARTVYTPGTDAPLTGDLRVTYHFYPPDRRSRDDDNIIASLKHARDSIAKALEVDDKQFRMQAPVWHEPVPGGKIEVEIEEL